MSHKKSMNKIKERERRSAKACSNCGGKSDVRDGD